MRKLKLKIVGANLVHRIWLSNTINVYIYMVDKDHMNNQHYYIV